MRRDGVGVGDIGEVHGVGRGSGDTAGGDDGGGAGRERDAGVVGGRGGIERDASTEPSGDRVGVGDGARGEHGACDVHGTGSGGAHGMRGDGVGVGDVGEVQGVVWGEGDTEGGDDGRGAGRELDGGLDSRRASCEPDDERQPCLHRVIVIDGAWGRDGACDVHGEGTGGAHGMRGDGVGVGDIGEVPGVA